MELWVYILGAVYSEYNNGDFGIVVFCNTDLYSDVGVVIVV